MLTIQSDLYHQTHPIVTGHGGSNMWTSKGLSLIELYPVLGKITF